MKRYIKRHMWENTFICWLVYLFTWDALCSFISTQKRHYSRSHYFYSLDLLTTLSLYIYILRNLQKKSQSGLSLSIDKRWNNCLIHSQYFSCTLIQNMYLCGSLSTEVWMGKIQKMTVLVTFLHSDKNIKEVKKKERFTLVSVFRSFSPWLTCSITMDLWWGKT
jgi:hypothetical protein